MPTLTDLVLFGSNDLHANWSKIVVSRLSMSSIELWSSVGRFEAMVVLLRFRRPCGMVDRTASGGIVVVEGHCFDTGMRQWFVRVGLGERRTGMNDSSRGL